MLRPRGLTGSRCPPKSLLQHRGCSPLTPRHPIGLFFSSFFMLLFLFRGCCFGFFFSLHPCSHHHHSALLPAGALHFLSLLPSLSSSLSLLFAAGGRPTSLHPSAPSRCLALGKDRPFWRGDTPPPLGAPAELFPNLGGPLVTAWGVPSLFAAPSTEPHLWNGALGNTDSSSGSLGSLFAPTEGNSAGISGRPSLGSHPGRCGCREKPSRVVPIKLFPHGFLHPLLCSWSFLIRLFVEAGPP